MHHTAQLGLRCGDLSNHAGQPVLRCRVSWSYAGQPVFCCAVVLHHATQPVLRCAVLSNQAAWPVPWCAVVSGYVSSLRFAAELSRIRLHNLFALRTRLESDCTTSLRCGGVSKASPRKQLTTGRIPYSIFHISDCVADGTTQYAIHSSTCLRQRQAAQPGNPRLS